MNILINALSVTNFSGRHVLLGHLSRVVEETENRHSFFILYHRGNQDIVRDFGRHVEWIEVPAFTGHWFLRSVWERTTLNRISRDRKIDYVFLPTGTVIPNLKVPQVTYAMNPWCLVPEVPRKPLEEVKAWIQRKAYKLAMKEAEVMVFLSDYMRQAYRANAGFEEKASRVIYLGLKEETFNIAEHLRHQVEKKPLQIVSVSVMAPHKGVETVIDALNLIRNQHGVEAKLALVGTWPDSDYEARIRTRVSQLNLDNAVTFTGYVERDELHRYYAESKVFCLMSWCESFGIPAVEAQAFGTPVVSSNRCAIPEVCGDGGVYPDAGDTNRVAKEIVRLLTDKAWWKKHSEAALKNAERYRWEVCSRAFLDLLENGQGTCK